jgi:hypothetical protein
LHAREALRSFQTNVFCSRETVAKTFLLFTDNIGTEIFSFLPMTEVTEADIASAADLLKVPELQREGLLQKHGIGRWVQQVFSPTSFGVFIEVWTDLLSCLFCRFETVTGPASSGKSFYVNLELQDLGVPEAHRHVVRVNEDWSTQAVLNRYRAMKGEAGGEAPLPVGMHFDISPYADFELLSRFFYRALVCGLLWDEATGDIECLDPTRTLLHVFIEIQEPPIEGRGNLIRTSQAIINRIPVVGLYGEPPVVRDITQIPLQVSLELSLWL